MEVAVEQLRGAMVRKDKKGQQQILNRVARLARQKHAGAIFSVPRLETGGMALGASLRQQALRRSGTALARGDVQYDGKGASLEAIRQHAADALAIPNPTDEAVGIDEQTELRLALEAANSTLTVPDGVNTNRELAKHAKTAVMDLVVPEDVAAKHWLVKRRERAASKEAYLSAKRKDMVKKYAAMLYVMEKERCDNKGVAFDPGAAERRALEGARYHYEVEPVLIAKRAEAAARAEGARVGPAIVKPKGQKRVRLSHKRKGPKRRIPRKAKVVKRVGGKPKKGRVKDGGGSQRKKRSGISGGTTGKSRFKKRKG